MSIPRYDGLYLRSDEVWPLRFPLKRSSFAAPPAHLSDVSVPEARLALPHIYTAFRLRLRSIDRV